MNLPPAALSLRDSDAACDLQNNGPKGGRNNMGTISIQMFAEDPIPRPPNDPLIYPQISTIKGHKDSMKKPFGGGAWEGRRLAKAMIDGAKDTGPGLPNSQ